MLAKKNRVNAPADFRRTMNKGKRVTTAHYIVSVLNRKDSDPTRFGFVVSKTVGNAVARNITKRRLREVAVIAIEAMPDGFDVVVRARENAADVTFTHVTAEVVGAFNKATKRG